MIPFIHKSVVLICRFSQVAVGRKPSGSAARLTGRLAPLRYLMALMLFALATPSIAQDEASPDATGDVDAAIERAREAMGESDSSTSSEDDPKEEAAEKKTADEGFTRTDALLASLTIFVLAIFIGFEVITKVPPTLHTPLMSGSNAISGITIVGALLATGFSENWLVAVVGMIALVLATINVVGGFLVTHRMLEMFKKKK